MPPIVYVVLVVALSLGLNAWQFKRNGALSEKLDTAEQELEDARKEAVRLADADKKHRVEIDGLRRTSRAATVVVAGLPDDGCWDRDAGDPAVDALRMLNVKPDSKTAAAAPGAAADDS